jgi:magnesium transporter
MGEKHTRVWCDGAPLDRDVTDDEIADYLADPASLVWIDLCAADPAELHWVAEQLGLNALAVEDALAAHERAKLDRYPGYLFCNLYQTALDVPSGELTTVELSLFVTKRVLVTVRPAPGLDLTELVQRWDSPDDLRAHGVSYLLYVLLDIVVDGHFAAVQSLDTEIEGLEDQLFEPDASDSVLQRRSFELRKSLVLLRRVVLPMREVLNTLMRRDGDTVPAAMMPYYQDVYDHVLRATEWTESLRDLVTTILDTRIALQDNRLNQVMKRITGWAAIIAVPTAVTGFYGMNVPYPGFGAHWGFAVSIAVLVVSAAVLYAVFRRNDWL